MGAVEVVCLKPSPIALEQAPVILGTERLRCHGHPPILPRQGRPALVKPIQHGRNWIRLLSPIRGVRRTHGCADLKEKHGRHRHRHQKLLKHHPLVKDIGPDGKTLVGESDINLLLRGLQDRHARSCDPPTGANISKPNRSRADTNQFATHPCDSNRIHLHYL